jgi:hypothetical protein
VYTREQQVLKEVLPMYDDVLAEPRLGKQLLKGNPDHQMFPLPHHYLTL